jgi:hypothetical protein
MKFKVNDPAEYLKRKLLDDEKIVKYFHQDDDKKNRLRPYFTHWTIPLFSLLVAEVIYLLFAFIFHWEIFNQDRLFIMPGPIVFICFAEIAICCMICATQNGNDFRYEFAARNTSDFQEFVTPLDIKVMSVSVTVVSLCVNAIFITFGSYYAFNPLTSMIITIFCILIIIITMIVATYWFATKKRQFLYLVVTNQRVILLDAVDGHYSYMYLGEKMTITDGRDKVLRITYNKQPGPEGLDRNESMCLEFSNCPNIDEATKAVRKAHSENI